jgi:outer membrane biosynthesis protein TonB
LWSVLSFGGKPRTTPPSDGRPVDIGSGSEITQ